jgi:beta-barrel assembly-enhancing protease
MIQKGNRLIFVGLIYLLTLAGCAPRDRTGQRIIFSIEDDIRLGEQVARQVDSTFRAQGQLMERNSSDPRVQRAYAHLDRITNRILNSGRIAYRDEFRWEVKLINDPEVQNAFATPGGHIYVFTGLIRVLNSEDHFAGVMGHEIAHSDRRHTMVMLQRQYGISILLSIIVGQNAAAMTTIAAQLAGQLAGLRFSRGAEREADSFSVVYLGDTNHYACDGAAGFFEQMLTMEQRGNPPQFLSTHPAPATRVRDIRLQAEREGCRLTPATDGQFQDFKRSLGLVQ